MDILDTGYINKNGYMSMTNSDIYIQDPDNDFVGMLQYGTSINSELGFSASSWAEINFTQVRLQLKSRNVVPTTKYTVGISIGNPGLSYNSNKVIATISNVNYTGTGKADTAGYLYITDLFNKLSGITRTDFTPSTTSWYLFIHNNSMSRTTRRFNRAGNYNSKLVFSGNLTNLKVYNGSSFQTGVPYVYDGTNFNPAEAYYYNGSNFVKI